MTKIACIGECMVELSERPDGLLQRGFGGDTLNTAIYLAREGMNVSYVTALGQDPFSNDMIRAWQEEGINTDLVLRNKDALPGLYLIQTNENGERRFSYWRDSAPVRRLLTHVEMPRIERLLLAHDQVYLSGITLSLFDAPSRARLFAILDDFRAAGRRIAFDTNFRPRGWPDRPAATAAYRAILQRADLVLASTEDLELLDPTTAPRDTLKTTTASEIVLKLPEPACLVLHENTETHVPGLQVETVIDTTAAGDSFAAAYIAARAAGHLPPEAARHGHRLAAQVIQHRGALIPKQASSGALPNTKLGAAPPDPAQRSR